MDEEVQALAARLVRRLKQVNATITIAESCTGGLLASTLTDISGASDWFEQSWVCYSYDSKINELEVQRELLESKGAVNAQVAIQMAEGARNKSGADLAISITGIAGPGSSNIKPEGMVCFSVAFEKDILLTKTKQFGPLGRDIVRKKATICALNLLKKALS